MSANENDWRVGHFGNQWELLVKVIQWEGPHQPVVTWRAVQTWDHEPDRAEIEALKKEAMWAGKFFGYCKYCYSFNLKGHMHNEQVCQGCAERHLGIVH